MSEEMDPPFHAYVGEAPFIFVSYSHQDKKIIYPEILRLHRLGYRIWYDEGINLDTPMFSPEPWDSQSRGVCGDGAYSTPLIKNSQSGGLTFNVPVERNAGVAPVDAYPERGRGGNWVMSILGYRNLRRCRRTPFR